jgi:hypothetical protein
MLLTPLLAIAGGLVSARAPDTSLATTPVAYYGANWNRSQVNVDALAKFQMAVLMQEDGHCWATCCPHRFDAGSQCGWKPGDPDATVYAGCDASCDEHGSQEDVFVRVAASAARQGLRGPHAVLYMNSVYLWPFDEASALGADAMVTDVHGAPHAESCDPGIFPSYFFDYGKPAGAKAWLDIVRRAVVGGAADGVYCDCCGLVPFDCRNSSGANGTCVARRNGKAKSINEQVTQASVDAHIAGKNATLHEAIRLVTDPAGNNGTFYNKVRNAAFGNTGNINWYGKGLAPPHLRAAVLADTAGGNYVVVGGSNAYSNPKTETLPAGQDLGDGRVSLQRCSDDVLAQFLLAVEPGAFLLCNGWDARFGRPLGLPLAPPAQAGGKNGTGTWSRAFASGVVARWDSATSKGTVSWPGVPTPAPTPPTPPPPTPTPAPAPAPPAPACPGPKCPPVPASNYRGCFVDKVNSTCDLPACQTGHCGHPECSRPYIHAMTVELCNALCAPGPSPSAGGSSVSGGAAGEGGGEGEGGGYPFFGVQAGGHGCFCGTSFGHFGAAPEQLCGEACEGNSSEVCGGPDVNSVYATVPIPSSKA